LQSVTCQQGVAYRHIILLALSVKFPKKKPLKSPKIAVVNNPTLIWGPRQEEPARVSAYTLYFQKLVSLGYIFAVGYKDAYFLQQSAFWPFKVIQGRWFWYQSKARVLLPINPPLSLDGPILHRFWDMATYWLKIAYFSYPPLIRRPRSMFRLEFRAEVNRQETRVIGLSSSENRIIVAEVVLEWHKRVADRRSDGRSDRIYHS